MVLSQAELNEGIVVIPGTAGAGLTVTVTSWVLEQPYAVNVYTYTTSASVDKLLVSVSTSIVPDPLLIDGVIPVTLARLHVNVVVGV